MAVPDDLRPLSSEARAALLRHSSCVLGQRPRTSAISGTTFLGDPPAASSADGSFRPGSTVAGVARRIRITGRDLTLETLAAIARAGAAIEVDGDARERMRDANAVIADAVEAGTPVYGVTTGLGSRVVEAVAREDAEDFSLRTVLGRATGVGEPLPAEVVRGAVAVRLNGLCAGGAGASPDLADRLAGLLNARVHPRIPRSGSIGASDLCLLAYVGLVLAAGGEAEVDGEIMSGAAALARAGLEPLTFGPKDGLAVCSSAAVSVAAAGLALLDARRCLESLQVSAALSMEGFRANLSPIDPRAVAARPAPGQEWSAAGLRVLLAGGCLTACGAARRVQDPLSFRCASQVHGSLHCALDLLERALEPELNGAADNPLVLADQGRVISTGNFHVPALALALDATAIAVTQVAALACERPARLATERLSGLPRGLSPRGAGRAGIAVLHKTAQSLALEIRQRAAPFAIHASVGADGVEDDATGALQSALRVHEQLERLELLIALELVCAAQAVDLAAPSRLGGGTAAAHAAVRELVAPLDDDRPLGPAVDLVADRAVRTGRLAAIVDSLTSG